MTHEPDLAAIRTAIMTAIAYIPTPGIDDTVPGCCEWRIEGAGTIAAMYRTIDRTQRNAARNAARIITGRPWSNTNPDGFPDLYRKIAAAYLDGRRIEVTAQRDARSGVDDGYAARG